MGLGPIARIIVRYGAGYLVLQGLIDAPFGKQIATDADLIALTQFLLGGILAVGTEGFYMLAKRMGWKT